jgi:hypothetical protein
MNHGSSSILTVIPKRGGNMTIACFQGDIARYFQTTLKSCGGAGSTRLGIARKAGLSCNPRWRDTGDMRYS